MHKKLAIVLLVAGCSHGGVTLSDATFDFGVVPVGAQASHQVTVTNSGDSSLSLALGAVAAPFIVDMSGCGATLVGHASCTLAATFAPTMAGAASASVSVTVGSVSLSVSLSGTGGAPAAVLIVDNASDASAPGTAFDFATQSAPSTHTFYLRNGGTIDATALADATPPGAFAFAGGYPGSGGTCGATLAAGQACSVVVTFTPSTGAAQGNIAVAYSTGVARATATRAVQGAASPTVAVSIGGSTNFGTYVSMVERTLTLSSFGGLDATLQTPTLTLPSGGASPEFSFKGGSYPGAGGTCGATLSSGKDCMVVVVFAPTGAPGDRSALLQVGYSGGGMQGSAKATLTAAVPLGPFLAVFDAPCDPGSSCIPPAAPYTFTASEALAGHDFFVVNTGSALAVDMTVTGEADPAGLSVSASIAALAPGASGSFNVVPNVKSFAYQGSLVVSYYGPPAVGQQLATRSVSYAPATSTTLVVGFQGCTTQSCPALDFGSVPAGNTSMRFVDIASLGPNQVAFDDQSVVGDAFQISASSCDAFALEGGSLCDLTMLFAPSGPGAQTGAVELSYEDLATGVTGTLVVHLIGTEPADAVVTVSSSACNGCQGSADLGTSGIPVDFTMTLQNVGPIAATNVAIAVTGSTSFSITTNACNPTLTEGLQCSVFLTYAGIAPVGVEQATFSVSYDDGLGNPKVTTFLLQARYTALSLLQLAGGAPVVDYGQIGTAYGRVPLAVTNNGGTGALGLTVTVSGDTFGFHGPSPGINGDCGTTLAPGATCYVDLWFTPNGATGLLFGTLTASDQDSQTQMDLSGTGAATAILHLSAPPCLLGSCGSSLANFPLGSMALGGSGAIETLSLTNIGGSDATGLTGAISESAGLSFAGGAFPGSGGTCGSTLRPAESCTIVVSCVPNASAVSCGVMTVNADGGLAQSTIATVSATTDAALHFLGCPTCNQDVNVYYPITGVPIDKTILLVNEGGLATGTITPSELGPQTGFKGGAYPGSGGTCPSGSLAPWQPCTLVITDLSFYSTRVPLLETLSLQYDVGTGSNATAKQSFLGVDGGAEADLAVGSSGSAPDACGSVSCTYDFAPTPVGTPVAKTFTLYNVGGTATTTITDAGTLAAPFSFVGESYPGGGTCTNGALASLGSCTFSVIFTPTHRGAYAGLVTLDYTTTTSNSPLLFPVQGLAY